MNDLTSHSVFRMLDSGNPIFYELIIKTYGDSISRAGEGWGGHIFPALQVALSKDLDEKQLESLNADASYLYDNTSKSEYGILSALYCLDEYLNNVEQERLKLMLNICLNIEDRSDAENFINRFKTPEFDDAIDILAMVEYDVFLQCTSFEGFGDFYAQNPIAVAMSVREAGYLMSQGQEVKVLPAVHMSLYDVYALGSNKDFNNKRALIDDPSESIVPVDEKL